MGLRITQAGKQLTLLPDTTLSLEIHSALFAEEVFRGTYSYSFTLPLDEANREVFGYPEIIESLADVRRTFPECDLEVDGYTLGRGGELRIQKVQVDRVQTTIVFGLSRVAQALASRKLGTFHLGGIRSVTPLVEVDGNQVPGLVLHALDTVNNPQLYDYVFAPFINHAHDPEPLPNQTSVPPFVVNNWIFTTQPILNNTLGGSFTYYVPFLVMGLPPRS